MCLINPLDLNTSMTNLFNKSFVTGGLLLICLLCIAPVFAQHVSASDRKELLRKEDTLKHLSGDMVFKDNASDRFRSDSLFTRILVRALKTKNSFYFPFDSLNISKLY